MEETIERPDRFRKVKDLVQNFKTNETVKNVQSHFEENKATYLVAAIGVIAYVSKSRPIRIINTVAPVITPVFNNANNANIVNNVGRLYKIVEDLDTGEMTKMVTALAAKIAEEHNAEYEPVLRMLSRHLNHPDLVPNVFGKTYAIAGTGTTG